MILLELILIKKNVCYREEIEEMKELLSGVEIRKENEEVLRRLRNLLNLL